MLLPGDPAPFFKARSTVNPQFNFDTVAGRYVVLSFFGSSRLPAAEALLSAIVERGERFDVTNVIFFGVTNDPDDVARISHQDNGRIYFFDLDLSISKLYGVVAESAGAPTLTPMTFILDPALRVIAVIPTRDDARGAIDSIFSVLDALRTPYAVATPPPVLIVPYVFEPELCQRLIGYYESKGGEDSGFMRDVGGRTVGLLDYSHKRRMDCEITDVDLVRATQERIRRRVVPAIRHAYQFNVTRIERHIVACYDARQGAHFRAHRDNTTLGTAHRRFAITINLNAPDYEGGEIWFPEFSPQKYKAASGAAIVFSCSLLHEVPKVTRGTRYAFLPFLYDDAAAAIRNSNRKHLGDLSGASGASGASSASSASGPRLTRVCDSPATTGHDAGGNGDGDGHGAPGAAKLLIDGSAGCGNPEGCETCLTSATYPIGAPGARPGAGRAGKDAEAPITHERDSGR